MVSLFFGCHFAGKPVVALQNVGSFLRLVHKLLLPFVTF